MSDYSKKCGIDIVDEYDKYTSYKCNNRTIFSTSHYVRGTGIMTSCSASSNSNYEESYSIGSGITELGDGCLSKNGITSISLPNTLTKIGSSCFRYSKISSISIPESVREIGHNNFPSTLTYITIPSQIEDFPTDNLQECNNLPSIEVDKNNTSYKSIEGILYNYDVTEILLCPRAKSGKVIIPNTVKRIAEKCFQGCTKLTMIELPRSIETIEDYAFSGLTLDRLVIPNTVVSVGSGCFANTVINKTFRFPQGITELPSYCFRRAIIPSTDFVKNVKIIGDHCFDVRRTNESLPEYLILSKITHIGEFAFDDEKKTKVIELPSSLSYIGDGAFNSTADDLKIVCLSIVPFKLSNGAFHGISDDATLYIPKGTKVIYENTAPWSTFTNIEEFELEKDFCEDDKEISDEHLYARLNSIANSIRNADRVYLKEILNDIALSYQYVDNDEDYEVAMELIKYNRRFNPALIPDLEKEICLDWTNKYKLRFAGTCIFDICSTPIAMPIQDTNVYIEHETIKELPMMGSNNIGNLSIVQDMTGEVDVHCTDILRHLQNELSIAERSIKVAVSWFTNYALFKQIKEFAQKGLDIHLIINNDSVNNGGYCLDFNELIEAGVHLSLVEYPHLIHHKFCIIDNKVVINGSYNWTRFSGNNYENIMIFRNNDYVTSSFNEEFEKMLQKAEHKDIDAMPESVPQRPEYDRNAFKQYVTEELDAEARDTSEQRDKITALQKAAKLNPEYFEKLNPKAKDSLGEAFKVVEQSVAMTKDIAAMVEGKPMPSVANPSTPVIESSNQSSVNNSTSSTASSSKKTITHKKTITQPTVQPVITKEEMAIVEKIKATDLFMVLDVSGSMRNTYSSGHVYNITKKAVSAALAVSDTQEVSLWKFGDTSSFVKNIGVSNLADINNVSCSNSGTQLNTFVSSANSAIKDNSLVIIFTDDDGGSINAAVTGMKNRAGVFWQIIVYGSHNSITSAISGIPNISLVSMTDYASKNDSEITQALLKDYINWKKQ